MLPPYIHLSFNINPSIDKKGKKDEAKEEEVPALKPSRPVSAYIFYSTERVPEIRKEEGIEHRAAMSRAGEIWGTMTDKEKEKYNKMHDADVKR